MCAARFGAYELHDLLALKQGGVGVLVSVAKDSCKVLLNKARATCLPACLCRAIQHCCPSAFECCMPAQLMAIVHKDDRWHATLLPYSQLVMCSLEH